jgi:hypothetical protein
LPLGVGDQGPEALAPLDPGGILRSTRAQAKGGLEGGVAEPAKASQDGLLVARREATLGFKVLEQGQCSQVGLEAGSSPDDEVSRSADVIGAALQFARLEALERANDRDDRLEVRPLNRIRSGELAIGQAG